MKNNTKELLEEVSIKDFAKVDGGTSKECRWAWAACVNDTALAGLGTSNPGAVCAYMHKVCK